MLVNNPCVNDSRVIKSAEALVSKTRHVTVICRHAEGIPESESRRGVTYERVGLISSKTGFLKLLVYAFIRWFSVKIRAAASWSRRRFGSLRMDFRRLYQRVRAYVQLSRRKLRNGGIRGVSVACGTLILGSWTFLRLIYKQLFRPCTVYCKLLLRRLRRRFIIHGKPLVRKVERIVRVTLRPFLTLVGTFFESDEFSSAAINHSKTLRPDVVHAHDLSTLPAGARIARRAGARLIYDSHELEMHRNATYKLLVKLRRQRLERKYIRKADAVITVSKSIAKHLRDVYRIKEPTVIMNSPIFEVLATPASDVRTDLNLGLEVPLTVYVGSVTIHRGLEEMVRALEHAPAMHFATVGPRRSETEQELVSIACEIGVIERVHFVDPVHPDQVVGYIRTSDVSVLPIQNVCLSYYYCMPNKLLESVFAGIPVAVADLLEMRRFVEAHGCGLIMDETDPLSIARALLKLMDEREDYVLPVEKRKQLMDRYGWPKQAENLRALYDSLLEPEKTDVKAA